MLAGEVIVKFSGDPAGFVKALEDIQKEVGATDRQMKQFTRDMQREADRMVQDQIKAALGIEKATKDMGNSFQGVMGTLKSFAGVLGVTFGVGAAVSYVKGIVELGSHLRDLSDQTDISASTLSRLKTTLETSGSTVDQFARVMFNMSRQIGEIKTTTDPALKAINDLGLNFDALRRMRPEDQMRTVAEALAGIDDSSKRAALGTALMGPAFRQVQGALMDVAKGLDQLNDGLSEENINRLNEFSKAWTTFANVMKFQVANALLTVGEQLDQVGAKFRDWLRDNVDKLKPGPLQDALNKMLAISKERDIGVLGGVPEGHPSSHEEARGLPTFTGLVDKEADNKIKSLTESLNKQIAALKVHALELRDDDEAAIRLKVSQQILEAVGQKNAAMFSRQVDEIVKLTMANKAFEETQKGNIAAAQAMSRAWVEMIDKGAKASATLDEIGATLQESMGTATLAQLDELKTKLLAAAGALEDTGQATERTRNQFYELLKAIQDLSTVAAFRTPDYIKAQVEAVEQSLNQLQVRLGNVPQILSSAQVQFDKFFDSISGSISGAIDTALNGVIQGTQTLSDAMRNMAKNIMLAFVNEINKQFILQPLMAGTKGFLDKLFFSNMPEQVGGPVESGGFWSGLWNSISGLFTSAASGGIVAGARGTPVPILAHAGEKIIPLGQREGAGSQGGVQVKIMGDIVPREPTMRREDVIQIGLQQFEERSIWMQSLEQRMSRR